MYDGLDVPAPRTPSLCLGCALETPHQCAGGAELLPYGGHCECPQRGCGPTPPPTPTVDTGK